MIRCSGCLLPYAGPRPVAKLIEEDTYLIAVAREKVPEIQRDYLRRSWLMLSLEAAGYCQTCVIAKATTSVVEIVRIETPFEATVRDVEGQLEAVSGPMHLCTIYSLDGERKKRARQ